LNITVDPTTNRINTYGFAYDAAGNLIQTPDGKTYAYDSENRMSQGNEGTYYYGSNGERLASGSPSSTSTWYFHGPGGIEVSLISAPSGTSCGQYSSGLHSGFCVKGSAQEKLYFAGRLVFQGDSFGTGGTATVTDRLGSVVQVDNASIADYVYYPYGGVPSGLMPNQVTFATYEAAGTSMLYAQNRFYDSARGRFTTADPAASGTIARPNSWNRYAYTEGDPVNFYDPTGEFAYVPPDVLGGMMMFWGSMLPGPVHQPMLGLDGPGSGGGVGGGHSSILSKGGAPAGLIGFLKSLKPTSNCLKILGGDDNQLVAKAQTINFYSYTDSGYTNMAGARSQPVTFSQYFAQYPSYMSITLNNAQGKPTPNVVLGPDFFGNVQGGYPTPYTQQQQDLFHEFFHVDTGYGDDAAVSHYGINVGNNQSASAALEAWLENDCSNKKP
jgi:RHS repeat-associated protein